MNHCARLRKNRSLTSSASRCGEVSHCQKASFASNETPRHTPNQEAHASRHNQGHPSRANQPHFPRDRLLDKQYYKSGTYKPLSQKIQNYSGRDTSYVLPIVKPIGANSTTSVAQIKGVLLSNMYPRWTGPKRILKKKLKVGHGGTLDRAATGLL